MPNNAFITRSAILQDMPVIQDLFVKSITSICNKDYTISQIEVWCSSIKNMARWEKSIQEDYFLVAQQAAHFIGFASLHNFFYIDFLYIHPDYQGQGVAGYLLKLLEKEGHSQSY